MNPAEEYILSKSEPWRGILLELQAVIKYTIPEISEQYKWNLPFYSLDGKMFCFLNYRKTFVDLGFVYGVYLSAYNEHLVAGEKRKNLRSLQYHALEDIDVQILQEILLAAKTLSKKSKP